MVEFAYNNTQYASTSHILFRLNCDYHFRILYEKEVDLRSKFKSANKLSAKLRELMIVY